MRTFDVPEWMIEPFLKEGVWDYDYYLYGAGRGLGFVRTAAHELEELRDWSKTVGHPQKVAEYHAYTGISAAPTAIDAIASWLNAILELDVSPPYRINLSLRDFRSSLVERLPGAEGYAKSLGDLGRTIDEHRQRAQHREGLAIMRCESSIEPNVDRHWLLRSNGNSGDRGAYLLLFELLRTWADDIEYNLKEIHNLAKGIN